MRNKLLTKKGESLIESLVAILIFTLASVVLYTMVTTASRINLDTRAREEAMLDQLSSAEKAQTPVGTGTVTVTVNNDPGKAFQVEVNLFGTEGQQGQDSGLVSYLRKP